MISLNDKWDRVEGVYKAIITRESRGAWLTDSQKEFVDAVNKKCFGRVYMHRPSDYMVDKLYNMLPVL